MGVPRLSRSNPERDAARRNAVSLRRSSSFIASDKAAFRLFDISGHFGKPLLRGLQRFPDGVKRSSGKTFLQLLDLIFREILKLHHAVLGVLVRADKFVQLELNRRVSRF